MIAKIRRHFINLVGHLFRGEDSIGNTDVETKDRNTAAEAGQMFDATSGESIRPGDGRGQIVPYLGFKNRLPYRIRPRQIILYQYNHIIMLI
jgi:hypothetical protein